MLRVGFEPPVPMFERTKTFHTLDQCFSTIGPSSNKKKNNLPGRGLTKVENHCLRLCGHCHQHFTAWMTKSWAYISVTVEKMCKPVSEPYVQQIRLMLKYYGKMTPTCSTSISQCVVYYSAYTGLSLALIFIYCTNKVRKLKLPLCLVN
jgi:hypothetical protein